LSNERLVKPDIATSQPEVNGHVLAAPISVPLAGHVNRLEACRESPVNDGSAQTAFTRR
jgi:hypothetical protein